MSDMSDMSEPSVCNRSSFKSFGFKQLGGSIYNKY